jgi:ABC-type spermidine/putrescine transport system permease subunit I
MMLAALTRKGHAERAWHALRSDPWTLMALAALAFLVVFVVLPLFELLRQSVIGQESGRFGLENFVTFFESRYFRRALGNSFLVATLGTVLALMIGLPLAFVFARYDFPAKRWIEVAILMSMLSPPFVGAYAWILMFGRSGLVTEAGRSIGLELPTIYGPVGIAIASAFGLYPLVFLVVRGALSRVSATIEEAAASLGRSPIYVVWSVTLPLVMPAVVTSALLVFLGIISDFGTPAILGEGERYPVLATLAFTLYLSEIGAETGMAATTSMILVGLALALVLVARFLATRRLVANDGASSRSPEPLPARTAWMMAAGVAALVLIEVKLVIKNALAKMISDPEIPTISKPVQTHTREVLIKTSESGSGDDYLHPAKIDYENPISSVYCSTGSKFRFKFATRDGVVGAQPENNEDNLFVKVDVSPADSAIAKIQVWKNDGILGLKMFNKVGQSVLFAG